MRFAFRRSPIGTGPLALRLPDLRLARILVCTTALIGSGGVAAADPAGSSAGPEGATLMQAPSKAPPAAQAGRTTTPPSHAFSREVADTCMKASNLRRPRALGRVIAFNDQVGMLAVLIEGTAPGAKRNAPRTEMLCLFDKVTRKPFFAEAGPLLPRAR